MGSDRIASASHPDFDSGDLPVWPAAQSIRHQGDTRAVLATRFEDWQRYHGDLEAAILKFAQDRRFVRRYIAAFGGVKVESPERWGVPASDLVCRRAMAFCRAALDVRAPQPFESWANIYRAGDYAMPHSHPGASASLLYVVAPGDAAGGAAFGAAAGDPLGGLFAIVDSRYPACCKREPGHLTNPVMPKLYPGMMLLFPGWLVHAVNPYRGTTPRITMTWNVKLDPVPESMAFPG